MSDPRRMPPGMGGGGSGPAADRPRARLFVEAPLAIGAEVPVDHARSHYLRHVLRVSIGSPVVLFNGRDGEFRARIAGFGRHGGGVIQVEQDVRPQIEEGDTWLLFAPIRQQRLDWLVEKATEMGVSRLQPVFTRHTQPQRVNRERIFNLAVEAAEQCERLTVPWIGDAVPLGRVLQDWPAERRLLLCGERGSAAPLAEAARACIGAPVAVLVGPEGGFAPSEMEELSRLPFVVTVGLGPRVLRAETAALAALAGWQAIAGDWAPQGVEARPPLRDGR